MTLEELDGLTLARAAAAIRSGDLSPVELTRAVLDRIESLNARTNAFITVTADEAMAQARSAMETLGEGKRVGPLHGVPVSLKDLIDTRGIRTTAASRVMADRVPDADAGIVSRLRAAGAILVGKTSLHEFAFGVTNVNPHYGPVHNPWDAERMSGGSSGGSAVSVATSMALASIGTDTGGSIRIPAALCGTVGLKPTFGRVGMSGILPLSPSLDHAGPITKTVEDAAIVLEVIAGFDAGDPHSSDRTVDRWSRELGGPIKKLRVGVPRKTFFSRLEPDVESAVDRALLVLEGLGASMVEVDLPDASSHEELFKLIATTEVFAYHERLLDADRALYGEDVRARMEVGKDIRAVDYVRALSGCRTLKVELDRLFGNVDVLAFPTLPITAPLIDQAVIEWPEESEAVLHALTRNTRLANLTGLPSISVPCGFSGQGLPVGLQLMGREFEETVILRAAHAYESQTKWRDRLPGMIVAPAAPGTRPV